VPVREPPLPTRYLIVGSGTRISRFAASPVAAAFASRSWSLSWAEAKRSIAAVARAITVRRSTSNS
jgi:hypothetical protein